MPRELRTPFAPFGHVDSLARSGALTDARTLAADPRWLTGAFSSGRRFQTLVNKLWALLNRLELRDIEDIKALLDAGGDLTRVLEDLPRYFEWAGLIAYTGVGLVDNVPTNDLMGTWFRGTELRRISPS